MAGRGKGKECSTWNIEAVPHGLDVTGAERGPSRVNVPRGTFDGLLPKVALLALRLREQRILSGFMRTTLSNIN